MSAAMILSTMRLEILHLGHEGVAGIGRAAMHEFGLMAAHGRERDRERLRVVLGQPAQIRRRRFRDIDRVFQRLLDALGIVETDLFLRLHHLLENGLRFEIDKAQMRQEPERVFLGILLDAIETAQRKLAAVIEGLDMGRPRLTREIAGADAHAVERVLEIAAGVFQRSGRLDALERVVDFGFAGGECDAVGQKADQRHERDHDDAHAHGHRGDEVRQLRQVQGTAVDSGNL